MDAITALTSRISVREYTGEPIPREVLESIVNCGRLAATAINIQPWEFVVITDPSMREKIAGMTDYGKFIADAAACIAVFCEDSMYFLEDGSAATQNILVAAWAHGVGSCWIAGDKKDYAAAMRGVLGVPETHRLISLVALGYPTEPPVARPKRSLDEVMHVECW
jgi:nitroreductase